MGGRVSPIPPHPCRDAASRAAGRHAPSSSTQVSSGCQSARVSVGTWPVLPRLGSSDAMCWTWPEMDQATPWRRPPSCRFLFRPAPKPPWSPISKAAVLRSASEQIACHLATPQVPMYSDFNWTPPGSNRLAPAAVSDARSYSALWRSACWRGRILTGIGSSRAGHSTGDPACRCFPAVGAGHGSYAIPLPTPPASVFGFQLDPAGLEPAGASRARSVNRYSLLAASWRSACWRGRVQMPLASALHEIRVPGNGPVFRGCPAPPASIFGFQRQMPLSLPHCRISAAAMMIAP